MPRNRRRIPDRPQRAGGNTGNRGNLPVSYHGKQEKERRTDVFPGDGFDTVAVASGIARLLAEKLLLLEGKTLEDGGSIEPFSPERAKDEG